MGWKAASRPEKTARKLARSTAPIRRLDRKADFRELTEGLGRARGPIHPAHMREPTSPQDIVSIEVADNFPELTPVPDAELEAIETYLAPYLGDLLGGIE